jgi:alpha-amylase
MLRRLLCLFLLVATPAVADWKDEIIYFVMVDRFADGDPSNNEGVNLENPLAFHGGDLKGLTERLDYIADLGATAIWLTPVNQQGPSIEVAEGTFQPHHGYWADDFNAIDPRYGTEDDLRALVEAAHARGIKVLLDVVYNHVGYNATWTKTRPHWLRQGAECGGDAITLCLAGLPDLKTERFDVRSAILDAHIGLAERTGVDGFRLDTYKHIEPDFWAAHRVVTRLRLGEDFFLLGEIWDGDKYLAKAPFEADTLDGIFDFTFRDHVQKMLTGIEDPERFARYFTNRHDIEGDKVLAPFLSNHDMPMLLAMMRGDTAKLRQAFALLMFAEGPPVISWGEEQGRRGKAWPLNREDMDWTGGDIGLTDDVKALIALRRAEPDMRGGPVQTVYAANGLLILRRGAVTLALNLSDTPVPVVQGLGKRVLFGGDPMALAPSGVAIFAAD